MKIYIFFVLMFTVHTLNAQIFKEKVVVIHNFTKAKYFTINPFGFFEPQATIGMGFGNHFSERNEYFGEISYIARTPFYDYNSPDLSGVRIITQYRYHFLQDWKPLMNLGFRARERRRKTQPFIGLEFRFKVFNFSGTNTFFREVPADTITRYNYKARATVVAGAFVFGATHKISKNGKWNLEVTSGIGARIKFVKYKNLPENYKILPQRKSDFLGPPLNNEAGGLPYFPIAFKLKYFID